MALEGYTDFLIIRVIGNWQQASSLWERLTKGETRDGHKQSSGDRKP